jgi:proteasome lid subunit RPN8/RPN11
MREARGRGLEVAGFYHSHPDHAASWSLSDLAEAHWLGLSYLITAVERGRAGETRAFLLAGSSEQDKRFERQEICAVDS